MRIFSRLFFSFIFIIFIIFIYSIFVIPRGLCNAKPMKVTYLDPGSEEDPFFGLLSSFMKAAAEDLGIELEIISANRNHLKMRQNGENVLAREVLPEYMLLINEQNTAVEILKKADELGVKTYVFNEGFFGEYKKIIGEPRVKFKNWLGELLPDDYQSGYLLAKDLINSAIETGNVANDGNVYIAGLAGVHLTSSTMLRVQGLKDAADEYTNVVVNQITPALYEREKAKRVTRGLLKRYPELNIVWAASDGMALGAVEAMVEMGKVPGVDLYTGGVDWATEAIEEVKDKKITASVGGHFMDGAWALIMLYDYHHGYEFNEVRAKSKFSSLTIKNISHYLDKFGDRDWSKIDFKQFSKTYNKEIVEYKFDLDSVLSVIESP